jgi:hypothetical protein
MKGAMATTPAGSNFSARNQTDSRLSDNYRCKMKKKNERKEDNNRIKNV